MASGPSVATAASIGAYWLLGRLTWPVLRVCLGVNSGDDCRNSQQQEAGILMLYRFAADMTMPVCARCPGMLRLWQMPALPVPLM